MGSSQSQMNMNGLEKIFRSCFARFLFWEKCSDLLQEKESAYSKQSTTLLTQRNSALPYPVEILPGDGLNDEFTKIKPIEIDSRVGAADLHQDQYMQDDTSSIESACDEIDQDAVNPKLTYDTEPTAATLVIPHPSYDAMLTSPRPPADDDTSTVEDMDLSQ